MKKISIDPVTRLEGHGRIDIFLNEAGDVANAYMVIPELRGFEKFAQGRRVEEMADITPRICGVCPEAHHMASTKACDAVFHIDPPPAAKKLRELFYSAFFVADHTVHFYILGGPDFVIGPDAPVAERNILGVIHKVGTEVGTKVIEARGKAMDIIGMLGGRKIHPTFALPGGVCKKLSEEERKQVEKTAREEIEFALFTLRLFKDVVLANKMYLDMILSAPFTMPTYYMGMVDANNKVNFYDGKIRVVDPDGKEFVRYDAAHYLDVVAEKVEPWTYLKFPYLKKIGWKGIVAGKDSGLYQATPLSRLNASDGMATPRAQEAYEEMYATLGGKPVHNLLATHWARLVELLYAAERLLELSTDPGITDPHVRNLPTEKPTEGVGVVEAPRGTLTHHYVTDERGIVTKANLVVGTTNNYGPISLAVKQVAQAVIQKGQDITEGMLNRVEMAFRLFDPCFGCATHTLPGTMPLEIRIHDEAGNLKEVLSRNL
ncbi:Ni/Fe hydrogenase subunit alpha [Syntrophorhabdus aromaticivorans]|uniref:Ni/Fe hydrogenase subunit alpha n=1 Tax=Syntrophorhabdus aromaticivorans TaxID=328301 RepID=A0A971M5A2_9BACT|nr:Ni/Fe hydrogenase subunit alpha [Syntrophorhabdus aromaticivorans]NLW36160.1 Ni/Fe hydrogenase subunit alpha [Syntrophorhabdus aromaticivorans]